MSATEATTTVATALVEEVKPTELVSAPVIDVPKVEEVVTAATEALREAKTEEIPAPAETTTVEGEVAPTATEEPAKEGIKPAEEGFKKPRFLSKIFFMKEKKKPAKSLKDEKKEEVEVPVVEEAPKEEATASEPAPTAEPVVEAPKVEEALPADPVKETETATPATESTPAPATEVVEEKKVEKKPNRVVKAGKRLSTSFADFLRPKAKPEATTPAKVDENPPMIEEPTPVAPLDNPASESAPTAESKPEDTATEATPAATTASPAVAAAA